MRRSAHATKRARGSPDASGSDGPGDAEGCYVDAAFKRPALPFNMMNALGRALLVVSEWRDAPDWALELATKLLRIFRKRLTHLPDKDCYDWSYQAEKGRGEDISHAAINVDLAARGAARGLVFDEQDMQRFANTFLAVVRRGETEWADTVSGTGTSNGKATAVPGWFATASTRTTVPARRTGSSPAGRTTSTPRRCSAATVLAPSDGTGVAQPRSCGYRLNEPLMTRLGLRSRQGRLSAHDSSADSSGYMTAKR